MGGPPPKDGTPSGMSPTTTIWPASGNGKGRSNTPSTMEKIAVVAPIPKASVSTAVSVKPGVLRSCRNA